MPTTQEEAANIFHIMTKHLTLSQCCEVARELYQDVGRTSENYSVHDSLQMISTLFSRFPEFWRVGDRVSTKPGKGVIKSIHANEAEVLIDGNLQSGKFNIEYLLLDYESSGLPASDPPHDTSVG